MFKYDFVLATLSAFTVAAVSSASASANAAENTERTAATCDVARLTAVQTDFPQVAQSRGEHGDVVVRVTINKDGRATHTQVTRSSGYATLDKAASDSILAHWRFDVSRCAPAAMPTNSLVTVQFQRAPQYTVSGTVNSRSAASSTQNAMAESLCATTTGNSGDKVVACHSPAPLVNSNVQPSLANRADVVAADR